MTAPNDQVFHPGNEKNDDHDSPQRSFLRRFFKVLPPELRLMTYTQSVLENEAVDLSRRENHRGPAVAQLRHDYFQTYWRYNTFYIPSASEYEASIALGDWCHSGLTDRIAAELTHPNTGRHILVEIGIHSNSWTHPPDTDYGHPDGLAVNLNIHSLDNLFWLVRKLGSRAAQVIQITCVYVTQRRNRWSPYNPFTFSTDTKAPAPEPIKSEVERLVQHWGLDRLYEMLATDQNGNPTPAAMTAINNRIWSDERIIFRNSISGQLQAAFKHIKDHLEDLIEDVYQDVTDQTNYDIMCAAYYKANPVPLHV